MLHFYSKTHSCAFDDKIVLRPIWVVGQDRNLDAQIASDFKSASPKPHPSKPPPCNMPQAKTEVALQFSECCAAEVVLQHWLFCSANVLLTKSCAAASENCSATLKKLRGKKVALSCRFQAPTFWHPRLGPADQIQPAGDLKPAAIRTTSRPKRNPKAKKSHEQYQRIFWTIRGHYPNKTRVLRQIAAETSPESSAKSLSHKFFGLPFLSPITVISVVICTLFSTDLEAILVAISLALCDFESLRFGHLRTEIMLTKWSCRNPWGVFANGFHGDVWSNFLVIF